MKEIQKNINEIIEESMRIPLHNTHNSRNDYLDNEINEAFLRLINKEKYTKFPYKIYTKANPFSCINRQFKTVDNIFDVKIKNNTDIIASINSFVYNLKHYITLKLLNLINESYHYPLSYPLSSSTQQKFPLKELKDYKLDISFVKFPIKDYQEQEMQNIICENDKESYFNYDWFTTFKEKPYTLFSIDVSILVDIEVPNCEYYFNKNTGKYERNTKEYQ